MIKAQKRARQILRKYNLSTAPIDLHKIVTAEGITLDEWSFRGRVKEVYVGDSIAIRSHTDKRKRRELIAHALGHHFLHSGNQFYFESCDQFVTFKQEHEAQCFATELLMPRELLTKTRQLPLSTAADYFLVTKNFLKLGFGTTQKGDLCH